MARVAPPEHVTSLSRLERASPFPEEKGDAGRRRAPEAEALLGGRCLASSPAHRLCLSPSLQCSPVTRVGTLGGCPTASSRAQPSTWATRSATAAIPASSWRATLCSPATLAPTTVPRGTSPCPPAEVGGQRGSVKWVATGTGRWTLQWDPVSSEEAAPSSPAGCGVPTLGDN